ncbi:MAG: response regulator, partial [Gammaproteobacteria bacterium]|nr:response regulator [Gammaproteobacteria bacterium]
MAYFKFPSFFPRGQKQKNDASDDRRNSKRFDPDGTTTILVVDDSRTVRFTLEKLLQQSGYKTISADDGESGIRMALEHQPVLVIMDVVMPGINGFQATRHLR